MPKRTGGGSMQRQVNVEVAEQIRLLRHAVVEAERELNRLVEAHAQAMRTQTAELATLKEEVAAIKTKVETPKP